ncbi:MAG: LPS export ABC transporter periplasmic protein LptC [Ignavibacteriae bacterium]|nr:LPS export ABC transporter periplasmic protein LptC [Ignavibacteriota bacterium]
MKKFLLVIFIVIINFSCGESKLKPQTDNSINSEEIPDQESKKAKITFTESGKLKAILYSDVIKVLGNKNEKYLEGVIVDFYNDKEQKTSRLTSKKGRVDDITQDMYAIENVIAKSDSGVTLTTEELVWKNKSKKIVTDKFVKIVSDKEIIEGYGFESDQGLRNYTIFDITYVTNVEKK